MAERIKQLPQKLDWITAKGRERRRQDIYATAFANIARVVSEDPKPTHSNTYPPSYNEIEVYTYVRKPNGDRVGIGTTSQRGSDSPTDVFINGIVKELNGQLWETVVIIKKDTDTGAYQVSAQDKFGKRIPPTARQLRKRLAFLSSYQQQPTRAPALSEAR